MSKELKQNETKLPADIDLFEEDGGKGLENVSSDEMIIPRIKLLQALSPEVSDGNAEYIEGARAGMFINSVNAELFNGKDGITVVPIHVRQTLIEWGLRENGGGFIADLSDQLNLFDEAEVDDKYRRLSKAGNQLVKSWEFLVYIVNEDGSYSPALMSFTSTQYKKGRKWLSQLKQYQISGKNGPFTPAAFYSAYTVTSVQESGNGNNWQGYKIVRKCDTIELSDGINVYKSAKAFRDSYTSGEVKAADPMMASEEADDPF